MGGQYMSNIVPKENKDLISGAAGAGVGTAFITLVQMLPENLLFKKYLIVIAPTLSIGIAALITIMRGKLLRYVKNKEQAAIATELKQMCEDAIQRIDKMINDPNITSKHKDELIKEKEEIHKKMISADTRKIEILYQEQDLIGQSKLKIYQNNIS